MMNSKTEIQLPDLQNLERVKLDKITNLPERSGIYFVISLDGQIYYIGKASNFRSRWQGHHRLHQFQALARKQEIYVVWQPANIESLDQLEKYYINEFCPSLNDTRVPSESECSPRKKVKASSILQQSLTKIAPYTTVFGIVRDPNLKLPIIVLRYFFNGVYDSPIGVETRKIRKSLKALSKKHSSLKWIEFIKRKDASWWKCKYAGYLIELAPMPMYEISVTRRSINSPMANILAELAYGKNWWKRNLDKETIDQVIKQEIPITQYSKILKQHPEGIQTFPIQSQATIKTIAGVEMMTLTVEQVESLNSQKKSFFVGQLDVKNVQLNPILDDPIQLLY